ncbi:hypothetical protein D3C78_1259500 [compost metagenome]
MAKIDGEDGKNDQPGGNLLAEQFDTNELACTRIDGAAHDRGFGDAQPVIDCDGAEQRTEGGGGEGDRETALQSLAKICIEHVWKLLAVALSPSRPAGKRIA